MLQNTELEKKVEEMANDFIAKYKDKAVWQVDTLFIHFCKELQNVCVEHTVLKLAMMSLKNME